MSATLNNLLHAVEQLCSDVESSTSGLRGAHKNAVARVRTCMQAAERIESELLKRSGEVAQGLRTRIKQLKSELETANRFLEAERNNHKVSIMEWQKDEAALQELRQRVEPWVEWCEPFGPNNEPVYMRVRKSVAIARMKQVHPELSDERALDEFLVVNWATIQR